MCDLSIDYNKVCKDCKTSEHLRQDHSSGDLVCTNCGLVAAEKAFDEGQDWRTFASEGVGSGNDGHAKQRADAMSAFDSMLEDRTQSTGISGAGAQALGLQKAQQLIKQADSGARAAKGSLDEKLEQERKIGGMTDTIRKAATRLTLGENIVQRCVMFLQDLAQKGHLTKQKKRPWLCALIHLASREEGATQTIREIAQANADYRRSNAAPPGSKGIKKDLPGGEKLANSAALESSINGEVRDLTKQLGLAKGVAYAEDPELMARLVGRLQLAPQCARPASAIVQETYRQGKLLGPKIGKVTTETRMAVSIYIVAWLLDVEQKPEIRQVAAVARVNAAQVMDAYLMVRPKLRYLMPALPKDFVCRLGGGVDGLPTRPGA